MKAYLDNVVARYEKHEFIESDPICIPHGFEAPQDQEVIGFFAAILAWGRRDVLIRKLENLCERMDYHPFRFVFDFDVARHAAVLEGFGHRTFKTEDALNLVIRLQAILKSTGSIESVCAAALNEESAHIGPAIEALSTTLLSQPAEAPIRLRKHLARPSSGSACKRLCMYFRWMVRPGPVDLGIWDSIRPDQLILPLDVHSGRQGRAIGLLNRKSNDWIAALELTEACRKLDATDPCKYDYALFGTGAAGETLNITAASN
jgi:uncharacterized protein (TIGR02757 family)